MMGRTAERSKKEHQLPEYEPSCLTCINTLQDTMHGFQGQGDWALDSETSQPQAT